MAMIAIAGGNVVSFYMNEPLATAARAFRTIGLMKGDPENVIAATRELQSHGPTVFRRWAKTARRAD